MARDEDQGARCCDHDALQESGAAHATILGCWPIRRLWSLGRERHIDSGNRIGASPRGEPARAAHLLAAALVCSASNAKEAKTEIAVMQRKPFIESSAE